MPAAYLRHCSCLVVAGLLACLSSLYVTQAIAGEAEPLQAGTRHRAGADIPSADTASERTWTQIVWDRERNRLARRILRLRDPLAAQGYDLFWNGDFSLIADDGRLAGSGKLVWREPASASYAAEGIVAAYEGSMRSGRMHGHGTYTHRSGLAYTGDWADGLMHGTGRLLFPDGDEYSGGFAQGEPSGRGIYVDATGTLYDGGFAGGMRDGTGALYPAAGAPFVATWSAGTADPQSVRFLEPSELRYPPVEWAQYQAPDDVRIGVLVDRTYYSHVAEEDTPLLAYTTASTRERLSIFPSSERVMDAWRGKAPISMTPEEEQTYEESLKWQPGVGPVPLSAGFLATAKLLKPVPVIVEFRNDSDRPLRIVNAFLDVGDSRTDRDPAVHMRFGNFSECSMPANFKADIDIENFGWSAAENAKLRFSFAHDPSRVMEKDVGKIDPVANADIADELRGLGIPVDKYMADPLQCPGNDMETCFRKFAADGLFGPLSGHVKLDQQFVRSPVTGTLEYDWRDSEGTTHRKSSPFKFDVILAQIYLGAECGEGAVPEQRQVKPFDFQLDKKNYRIMIPLRDDIPPGVTGRWRIRLQAPKSSQHDFRVVFELADGRQIASRPIDLLYFMPKVPETQ